MNLLLHVGHGKTGSSYLQSWLACNALTLKNKFNILYPLKNIYGESRDPSAVFGNFSMGNGYILEDAFDWCQTKNSIEFLERLIAQNGFESRNELRSIMLSSEKLLPRIPDIFPILTSFCGSLNISTVEVLLYVRDPLGHACSVYSQMVKRHGYCKGLDEWVLAYNFPLRLLRSLQVLSQNSGFVTLYVQHYDRQKSSILDGIIHLIKSCENIEWILPPKEKINRSLTFNELKLMCLLNKEFGDKTSILGEYFVNNQSNLTPAKLIPSPIVQDLFIEKWQPTIDDINNYLPSESALSLQKLSQEENQLRKVDSDNITLNTSQIFDFVRFLKFNP